MGDEVKLYCSSVLISSATIMTGEILQSDGNNSMHVSSGGTANSTTVNRFATLHVSSGGLASSTHITANGIIRVSEGAAANSTTVNSGGWMYVTSGGTADNTTIRFYGKMYVSSGGTANNTVINGSSGRSAYDDGLHVSCGGAANGTIVNHGGRASVSSGGTANNTTVNDCGWMYIASNGTANSTTVNSGGYLVFSRGGTAQSVLLKAGGRLGGFSFAEDLFWEDIVNGSVEIAPQVTITGNSMTVLRGGTADNTTVNSGGLYVYNGGKAANTIVNQYGNLFVFYGGAAENATVHSGGNLHVSQGGVAENVTAYSGGSLHVSQGGVVENPILSGGYLYIASGGVVRNIQMAHNGNFWLNPGGVVEGLSVKSGVTLNLSGSGYSDIDISSGGAVFLTGGYGLMGTEKGQGEIVSAVVYNGGLLSVSNKYDSAAIRSAVFSSGGSGIIGSCCFAVDTLLVSGGAMTIQDLATAENTRIDGGTLRVLQGGKAKDSEISTRGKLMLEGIAENVTVNSDGALFIGFNGVAENITVHDGGNVFVDMGGEVKGDISISESGGLHLYGGSIVDGVIHVKGSLNIKETVVNNGTIAVDLNAETASAAMIQNLDCMAGTHNFTVESGSVGEGCYMLASGAENYSGTVTIENGGTELGELAIGETKTFRNVAYTLSKNADTLSLSIFGAVVTNTAKSDVDGNNISDVMFQYTGGDYQIGFWMNGSSTWQGTGASQPANWELLGAYDMDSSGMADQVMFGNVLGGAYIGYYKDGDTTSGGWQNIGYLNNPDGIKWDNVIGNVTGNAGQNSIVWHAAELGAVGVWTDGTGNWVSIDGYYGTGWELQGTGDFTGDGKDEILFSNAGNLYTVDLDSNFASLGDASGWEVRAIGDFSGDGTDDIVLFHHETGSVMKYENGQASQWKSLGQLDASDWFIVGAGDYDNDLQDDLLVRQYSTGMLGYYSAGDMSKWNEMGRDVDMNWTVIA